MYILHIHIIPFRSRGFYFPFYKIWGKKYDEREKKKGEKEKKRRKRGENREKKILRGRIKTKSDT